MVRDENLPERLSKATAEGGLSSWTAHLRSSAESASWAAHAAHTAEVVSEWSSEAHCVLFVGFAKIYY
jgi:hypothetical protein